MKAVTIPRPNSLSKKDSLRLVDVLLEVVHEGIDFPGKELEVVVIGRSPYVPRDEEDKYYPGTKS